MAFNIQNKALQSHIQSLLYFWRGNGYAGPLKKNELFKVSESLVKLQRGLTGERTLAGTADGSYMQDNAMLGAYLLYYWPVTFMQVQYGAMSIQNKIDALIKKEGKTIKILDLGSGPGPAGAALCDVIQRKLGDKSKKPVELTLVDYSSKALGMAKKMFARDFSNVSVNTIVSNFEKGSLALEEGDFDIIITSHCINELWNGNTDCLEKRVNFIKKACEYLCKDGIIFINEPALLLTSRNLLALRNSLIKDGFKVIAPCSCNMECSVLQNGPNQTCHALVEWTPVQMVADIAKSAKLDRTSVKMTYFVFEKQDTERKIESDNCTEKKEKESELIISGTVVSDGMLNKAGRVRFVICSNGNRITVSAKQDDDMASIKGFFSLKRYDRVTITEPEIRGDKNNVSYGIKDSTVIKIDRFVK